MTRFALILTLVLTFPFAVGAATKEVQDATLKYDITVEGPAILLSDILEGAPRAANITVTRAPRPGQAVALNPIAVLRLAARYRIRWNPPQGLQRITVRRASQLIDASLLQDEIALSLADAAPGDDLEIQFAGRRGNIHIDVNAAPTVAVESLDYDSRSGRFTAIVAAPANDPTAPRHRINGRAWRMVDVPVLAGRIKPGHEIEERHIAWKRVRADKVRRQTVVDMGELVGMSLKRNLAPNRMIRQNDLRRPVMVAKGDIVTMHFRSNGLNLSASGRAIEDGGRNAVIRVINERSRLTIEGRITAPGQVVVGDMLPRLSRLEN